MKCKNKLGILIKRRLNKKQRLGCIYYYLCWIIGYSPAQARESIEAMEIYQLDELAEQGYGSKYQYLDAFNNMVYD